MEQHRFDYIELTLELAKEIVESAVSGNPTKRVIRFFYEHNPLGYDFDKHGKFKDSKSELKRFLNLDFLFYQFVETDFLITSNLRSLYWTYVQKREYYNKPAEIVQKYIRYRLNDLISFREYLAQELFKIIGPPKIVTLKYTSKYYNRFEKKKINIDNYGDDRNAISTVISSMNKDHNKIHSAKVCENKMWNKYNLPFCKTYKELIEKYGVSSAIIFDN